MEIMECNGESSRRRLLRLCRPWDKALFLAVTSLNENRPPTRGGNKRGNVDMVFSNGIHEARNASKCCVGASPASPVMGLATSRATVVEMYGLGNLWRNRGKEVSAMW